MAASIYLMTHETLLYWRALTTIIGIRHDTFKLGQGKEMGVIVDKWVKGR
jgi:hypothetical protein